jgi:hypothetical protein
MPIENSMGSLYQTTVRSCHSIFSAVILSNPLIYSSCNNFPLPSSFSFTLKQVRHTSLPSLQPVNIFMSFPSLSRTVTFISPPYRHSSHFSFLCLILVEIIISSLFFFSFIPFVRKIPFSVSPTSFSSPSCHYSSPPSFLPFFLFHAL